MFAGEGGGRFGDKEVVQMSSTQHSSSLPVHTDLKKDVGEGQDGTTIRVGQQAGASGYFRESLLCCSP